MSWESTCECVKEGGGEGGREVGGRKELIARRALLPNLLQAECLLRISLVRMRAQIAPLPLTLTHTHAHSFYYPSYRYRSMTSLARRNALQTLQPLTATLPRRNFRSPTQRGNPNNPDKPDSPYTSNI